MLRFVVLSDLHAHQQDVDDASAPSRLSLLSRHQDKAVNPVAAFPEALKSADFAPQLVICPGDLGDKNDGVAQQYAWAALEGLKKKVHANRLIGVVGNHDLDSRRTDTAQLPNSNLKTLSPTFPLSSKAKSSNYWSDGFVFYEFADACILLVNSCAFHGVATSAAEGEHLNGKISKDAIQSIKSKIKKMCKSVNVMVVHHHIRQHPWLPNEKSHIENGPELLEVLGASGHQWLVLHGHAHMPHIGYASTDALSPIIFSAGSVSATLWSVPNKLPRNQAYAVELFGMPGNGLKGRILTWDWAPYVGWTPAATSSGLPYECGFGHRPNIAGILGSVDTIFLKYNTNYLEWDVVKKEIDVLPFLTPDDRDTTFAALKNGGITVHFDGSGNPTIFSR